jgi:KUP system potassium uptake protein
MQLGYSPRLHIVHTSSLARGQVYVPEVNSLLFVACCVLTLGFRSSSNLAAAYGLAVTGVMTITSILMYSVARLISPVASSACARAASRAAA